MAEGAGDNRTLDKTIGEIKYAKKPEKKKDKEPTGALASQRHHRLSRRSTAASAGRKSVLEEIEKNLGAVTLA